MTRHVFANVGRHAPRKQRAAYRTVKQLAPRGGITGWAEVGEGDGGVNEPAALRAAFPPKRWATCAIHTHTPVTFRRGGYDLEHVHTVKAMSGIPRISPHRYVVVVRLKHRESGHLLSRINTHFVAGAFNGRQNRNEALRVDGWWQHWSVLKQLVAEEHQAGRDVVVSGDFNRQGLPRLHRAQRVVLSHSTDHVIAIPVPGRRAVVHRTGWKRLGIDFHRAMYADVTFEEVIDD